MSKESFFRSMLLGALFFLAVDKCAWSFQGMKKGDKPLELTLPTISGQQVDLSDFKNDVLALVLVKQGQQRSVDALKSLAVFYKTPSSGAISIIAILVNPEEGDPAPWLSDIGAEFPVLVDTSGKVLESYKSKAYPATGVFGREDGFRGYIAGYLPSYLEELDQLAKGMSNASNNAADREAAEAALEKAQKLLSEGSRDAALASARDAVLADNSFSEPKVFLGTLLLDISENNADEALKYFDEAAQIKTGDIGVALGLARIKSIKGDFSAAIDMLEKAIAVSPKPEHLYYHLGRTQEKAGNYEKAVESYRKALDKLLMAFSN